MPALAPDCGAQASIAISLHFPKPLRLMGTTSHCGAKERKAEIAGTWNGAKLPSSFTLPQPLRLWSSGRAKQGKTFLFCRLFHFFMYFSIWTRSKIRTPEVPSRVRHQKNKSNCIAFHSFSTIISYKWGRNTSVYSMKSMFLTNEKLSVIVAWSSSVSISRFKVQSSIGHLVWFFDVLIHLLQNWFGFLIAKLVWFFDSENSLVS